MVVAIPDVSGVIYDLDGLDTRDVLTHEEEPGAAMRYNVSQKLLNEELLELDVDVSIPAAISNVLAAEDADDVRADLVVEGANRLTTSTADEISEARGILIVPDTLASAGGVATSYSEWLQDFSHRSWSLERIRDELGTKMLRTWTAVRERVEERDMTWRDAAYIVAFEHVSGIHEHRGLWP